MSRHTSWSRLSVEEFFSRCNWQGQLLMPQAIATGANHQIDWQCLSVEKFFNRCNWQGQLPPMPQAAETGANHHTSSWQCLSVQEFFNRCNWQGQPLDRNTHHDPYSHLKAPVREFFQFIPWEGRPEIGSLPNTSTPDLGLATFDFTLTDLSELF